MTFVSVFKRTHLTISIHKMTRLEHTVFLLFSLLQLVIGE